MSRNRTCEGKRFWTWAAAGMSVIWPVTDTMNITSTFSVIHKYLPCTTFSMDVIPVLTFWFSVFWWWQDMFSFYSFTIPTHFEVNLSFFGGMFLKHFVPSCICPLFQTLRSVSLHHIQKYSIFMLLFITLTTQTKSWCDHSVYVPVLTPVA